MIDVHLHLQDQRLAPFLDSILNTLAEEGVQRLVVNGTSEKDWPQVLELAKAHPGLVIPSFGLHPWFVDAASPEWRENLVFYLDAFPNACVGEAGLDRWIAGHDLARQAPILQFQMKLASERNRPLSIHCLKAWGRILEILRNGPLPDCGFLLHSYGGPAEMIPAFARLGAYFSFSGYYLHERKADRLDVLKAIPRDRLLIETDAPDMAPPDHLNRFPLPDGLNHPGNLSVVYEGAATVLGCNPLDFRQRIGQNFQRLFDSGL